MRIWKYFNTEIVEKLDDVGMQAYTSESKKLKHTNK